jgi:formylglycine-generating enzyme required for sulfatase activity
VTIYYEENAQVEIVSPQGGRVLVDVYSPELLSTPPGAQDILLTTHTHPDHINQDFLASFLGQQLMARSGKIALPGMTILGIPAAHNAGDALRPKGGTNYIFLVETSGLRIAHFGDIGQAALTAEQLRALGQVDIAITQFANPYSDMDATNQKGFKLMEQLNPRLIIPTHVNYDTAQLAAGRWDGLYTDLSSVTLCPENLSDQTQILFMGQAATNYAPRLNLLPLAVTPAPNSATATGPGTGRISPQDGMPLVYVPAGEFLMGSTDQDPGADIDEKPQHRVFLEAFWMGQTEVTNAMFAAFLSEKGNQVEERATWLNAAASQVQIVQDQNGEWQPRLGFEDHPVAFVTWYAARAYCAWAGGRLPTEAEWEKAARGVNDGIFPWGGEIDCSRANYLDCNLTGSLPVGSLLAGASPYNALDMTGNVWEWVADWHAADYYTRSPAENPAGPETGLARVVRGGSWLFDAKHARPANRRSDGPLITKPDYGFRCAFPDSP